MIQHPSNPIPRGAMRPLTLISFALILLVSARPAWAYLGPGGAVSAIGTLIALGAAILIAIIGFLWFPIRRLMRRGDDQPADDSIAPDALGSDAADASTDPDPTDRP